eukprot:2879276-Ditylum_brightwellii.AAC.1
MNNRNIRSTVVTSDQTAAKSPVTEQRIQLGLAVLGGGGGSDRKNQSTDATCMLQQSNSHGLGLIKRQQVNSYKFSGKLRKN